MGSGIFSWITDINELCSTSEFSQFFYHYFKETDVCFWTFIIGMIITVVLAAIFYFGIGCTSYRYSKPGTWGIFLLITLVAVFFFSLFYVGGRDGGDANNSAGMYADSYIYQDNVADTIDEDEELADWNELADSYRQALAMNQYSVATQIAFVNTGYAFFAFLLLSLCFRPLTPHAKNCPI